MKQLFLTILSFLVIDLLWIALVMRRLYDKFLPDSLMLDSPKWLPAILFYLLFCVGLWFLVIREHGGDMGSTLLKAAVFGSVAYGTFALTNLSIIRDWSAVLTLADTVWGGVLATLITYTVLKLL
jgi:uncharacterized membrane protein